MKYLSVVLISVLFIVSCTNKSKENSKQTSKMSITELNKAIKSDTSNASLYQLRAERFYKINQIDSALQDYIKAVELDGNQLPWLSKLSDIYLFKGQSEKARQTLDEALKLEPNNTDVLLQMGMLYLLIEDYTKSFEYINNALAINPNLEKAYFYKSMSYIEVGDTARAIGELQKAVEKKPDYIDAYIQLGLFYDALGDTIARIYYKNALKIDSTNAFVHYDLALHYQNKKEFSKAIDEYLYIVDKLDSNFSTAFHNIGYIYLVYSDDFDSAIFYFDKAISADFNYAEAYINKGYALELKKQYRDAFVEYQTALQISPENEFAKNGIDRISKYIDKPNK